jgi:selenocysteine lyase/cysteine desulfurase
VTGRVNPVRQWFEAAKAAGAYTLLDACQTAGRVSVIPEELCADMAVFSGHKGLRGPLGCGALYVAPGVSLHPVFTGGTGVKSDLRLQPEEMPARLEPGTPNTQAFAGLSAAVRHYMEHTEEIIKKEKAITERFLEGFKAVQKVRVFDEDPSDRLPVISFSAENMDAEDVGFALSAGFGIECRAGLHCAPLIHKAFGIRGTVRLSPSYMNGANEIEYVLEAVKAVTA